MEHGSGTVKALRVRSRMLACALAAMVYAGGAAAQVSDGVVKIAISNDQSGIFSAAGGFGVVIAARMAVEDAGGAVLGKPVEVVFADNQSKPDIGVSIARRWFDAERVDVIVDGGNSAVGMALQAVAKEKNKLFLISGSGTTALTNQNCSANGFQWSWDTYALAAGTANAMVKQGSDTWFFITADYTFGQLLEAQSSEVVKANKGRVIGSVRHPFNNPDYSSLLLQAQSSGQRSWRWRTRAGTRRPRSSRHRSSA